MYWAHAGVSYAGRERSGFWGLPPCSRRGGTVHGREGTARGPRARRRLASYRHRRRHLQIRERSVGVLEPGPYSSCTQGMRCLCLSCAQPRTAPDPLRALPPRQQPSRTRPRQQRNSSATGAHRRASTAWACAVSSGRRQTREACSQQNHESMHPPRHQRARTDAVRFAIKLEGAQPRRPARAQRR